MLDPKVPFSDLYHAAALDLGSPYFTVWKVKENLPYFDGHFPGNPIFPAVGIVDATLMFLKGVLKNPKLPMPTIANAKFLSPILPDQTVRIELSKVADKVWQAEWKDETSKKLLATLRVDCGAAT